MGHVPEGVVTFQDAPAWARGVLAQNAAVTPTRDGADRRSTDATRITFPLQLVLIIACGVATTVGSVWAFTSSIKADLRVVIQRLDDDRSSQILKDQLWQRQQDMMQKQVDANERKLELLRLEYQQFREQQLTRKVP